MKRKPRRDYFEHADKEMIPKMQDSVMSLTIWDGTINAKIACEFGAAILLDKPIIVVAKQGSPIPANLKRCASRIIEIPFDAAMRDPKTQMMINEAIAAVLQNDRRAQ